MLKNAQLQEDANTNMELPHISIAPMMDWTDRHCRYFHRLLSPHVRLYSEMVTTGALLHGDVDRHLRFNPDEHYVALQLGGSEADDLATCAKMGEDYGYDEINLNCGCPSDRVQKGAFGAFLMKEPDTVARCVESMRHAVDVPVTVKCRIGVDDCDPEPFLRTFLKTVSNAGCEMFITHARKAWLNGLSPKENREVPPLDYNLVAQMKSEFPRLKIILNGGIKTIDEINSLLLHPLPSGERIGVKGNFSAKTNTPSPISSPRGAEDLCCFDGIMIGREAYQNPSILLDIERDIFNNKNVLSAHDVVHAMIPYIEQQMRDHGTPLKSITRHMIGLFGGQQGSRAWRRTLSVDTHKHGASSQLLLEALKHIKF